MNKYMNPIGLERLRVFITADALLATILLVWQQLWIHPSIELFVSYYSKNEIEQLSVFTLNAGIGLTWTLSAVLFAIFALVWAIWQSLVKPSDKTPTLSIGFFSTSLIMTILNVFQSLTNTIKKTISPGSPLYEPLNILDFANRLMHIFNINFIITTESIIFIALGIIILIILATCLSCAYKSYKCLFKAGVTFIVTGLILWSALLILFNKVSTT